jgi:hypothetical protein
MKILDLIFGQLKEQAPTERLTQEAPGTEVSEQAFLSGVALETERDLELLRRQKAIPVRQPVVNPNAERETIRRENERSLADAARDYKARQKEIGEAKKRQERQEREHVAFLIREGLVRE